MQRERACRTDFDCKIRSANDIKRLSGKLPRRVAVRFLHADVGGLFPEHGPRVHDKFILEIANFPILKPFGEVIGEDDIALPIEFDGSVLYLQMVVFQQRRGM